MADTLRLITPRVVEKIKRERGGDRDVNKDRAGWEIRLKSARELNRKIKGKRERERGQKSRDNQ